MHRVLLVIFLTDLNVNDVSCRTSPERKCLFLALNYSTKQNSLNVTIIRGWSHVHFPVMLGDLSNILGRGLSTFPFHLGRFFGIFSVPMSQGLFTVTASNLFHDSDQTFMSSNFHPEYSPPPAEAAESTNGNYILCLDYSKSISGSGWEDYPSPGQRDPTREKQMMLLSLSLSLPCSEFTRRGLSLGCQRPSAGHLGAPEPSPCVTFSSYVLI